MPEKKELFLMFKAINLTLHRFHRYCELSDSVERKERDK